MLDRNAQKNEVETGEENSNTVPKERWVRNTTEWNPGLSSKIKTNRAVGRPKKM